MNTYELDTLSIQYIRRPVDDASREDLSAFFLAAYNEIYRRIMSEAYKVFTTESIILDKNNSFSVDNLSKSLIYIKCINSSEQIQLKWEKADDNKIFIYTNSKTVYITYYYMPHLLENNNPVSPPASITPSNTPIIPKEYHNIFSLWAAYRYLHSRRKFEDANYYYEMAMELFGKLDSSFSSSAKLNINYLS